MQISGLPVSATFGAADVLAIEINGVTYKVTGATLAAALESMGNYVIAQDIANNLTTTDEGYVLDARQGKALLDAIEALGDTVEALGDPVEVAHGGTGTGTAPTPGGMIYGASGTAFGSTPAGTAGQFLRSGGPNAPQWATVDKATVGLGNVDNTSDMDKPVSTAQQAAIDAISAYAERIKADLVGLQLAVLAYSMTTDATLAQNAADMSAVNAQLASIPAMIAAVEATNTASQSHAVGSLVVVGDVLYIVTSAISPGETIAPGTNCANTTIDANLLRLDITLTKAGSAADAKATGDAIAALEAELAEKTTTLNRVEAESVNYQFAALAENMQLRAALNV